jgi:hypothetical protein
MQGVKKIGREGSKRGAGQKRGVHGSAVHICIIARACSHLMNIVFWL